MKAVIYREFGTPEVLEYREMDKPAPGDHEVLVKVLATTVTAADCMMRRGDTVLSRLLLGFVRPRKKYQILGTEFSGIIEAVGRRVTKFRVGDEVFAFRGFGTGCYAQFKCMNENGSIAIKPDNASFKEAASLVDGATTAYYFLREKADIQKGQNVLIIGASGSIGTFAVQLAAYFGAEATGVCSTKNGELVRSLGAVKVVDYTKEDFTKGDEKYDIIFDTVGRSSFSHCRKILKEDGKYVVTVMTIKCLLQSFFTIFAKKKVIFAMSLDKTKALIFICKLFEEGHIRTIIDREYSPGEIKEAHAYVESGHKRGNVVINVPHAY